MGKASLLMLNSDLIGNHIHSIRSIFKNYPYVETLNIDFPLALLYSELNWFRMNETAEKDNKY